MVEASHVYGPVPSRRLGRSLGVSLVPHKVCTYTCVYCQLGRTTELSVERRSFLPPEEVLADLSDAMAREEVDFVTFLGEGEPTLSLDLGRLLEEAGSRWDAPTAVLTNGAMLWDPEVSAELMAADLVMPTVAAGSEAVWRRLHRPHPSLGFERVVEGLVGFSEAYGGRLVPEVMLVDGVNDSDEALLDTAAVLRRVRYDSLDITVPTRPPTEAWAGPPPPERVLAAQEALGTGTPLTEEAVGDFGLGEGEDPAAALVDIGSRHPLTEEAARTVARALGAPEVVDGMLSDGRLVRVVHRDVAYVLPQHLAPGRAHAEEAR